MSYSKENIFLIKTAQYFSVITALAICVIKIYGWHSTNSAAMFASLIDSLLDISSSAINIVALRMALVPPDHNHRFGHNKIEDLAVFGQSIFIASSGCFALYSSGEYLFAKNEVTHNEEGLWAIALCLILTIALISYQAFVIKKTHSNLIKADKLHYFSDLLTSLMVMLSLYFSTSFWMIDAIFGALIAIYVILGSYSLMRKALRNLIDHELNDHDRQKIIDIISLNKNVKGVHEMKTRYAGNKPFIQFHIELDGNLKLTESHKVSEDLTKDILKKFKGAEIIIHQDPFGLEKNNPYTEFVRIKKYD